MSTSLRLAVFFFAATVLAVHGQNPCGSADWRYSPHTNKCYKLFNQVIGWVMAEFKCVFQGAHHIAIHDAADNQFVSELARQAGMPIWLGAAQFGTSHNYLWPDHTTFDYENWEGGRRPAFNKGRKCTKIDGRTGKWTQSCCKKATNFICMKPASFVPNIIEADEETTTVVDDNTVRRARFFRARKA